LRPATIGHIQKSLAIQAFCTDVYLTVFIFIRYNPASEVGKKVGKDGGRWHDSYTH